MRVPVELSKAYRVLNHGPVTLVTSAAGGRRNIMAASWAMPLDFSPPKVAVVIDVNTYTRQLVDASGVFALNIPCRNLAQATLQAGSIAGGAADKFAALGVSTFAAEKIEVPLVEGCVAWLECRVLAEPHNQERHDLFVAEVIHAQADDRVFSRGRWKFEDDGLRTLHYLAGGSFFVTGEALDVKIA